MHTGIIPFVWILPGTTTRYNERHVALRLAYLGAGYQGFAIQETSDRTIEVWPRRFTVRSAPACCDTYAHVKLHPGPAL